MASTEDARMIVGLTNRPESKFETVTVISRSGDVLLIVSTAEHPSPCSYRVDSVKLSSASAYFAALLNPGKFTEGTRVQDVLKRLGGKYSSSDEIPASELPSIGISDIGRIGKVKHIQELYADFLRILHGQDISYAKKQIPLANLANLAVVADCFDATSSVQQYVTKKRALIVPERKSGKEAWNEEKTRMKILVGLFFGYSTWLSETHSLILKGSIRWTRDMDDDSPLWWDLPTGLEEELQHRRLAILRTFASLQEYFLTIYTSNTQQCKLGYSNSRQCDSFQLGEMARFFSRLGMLSFTGTTSGLEATDPYDGDIEKILDALRQCPSYQIDEHHHHCGLRDRLVPCIRLLEQTMVESGSSMAIGICESCWNGGCRAESSWKGAKGPLVWSQLSFTKQLREGNSSFDNSHPCMRAHLVVRDLFLADRRNWAGEN